MIANKEFQTLIKPSSSAFVNTNTQDLIMNKTEEVKKIDHISINEESLHCSSSISHEDFKSENIETESLSGTSDK